MYYDNMPKVSSIINKVTGTLLIGLLAGIPLFFLPITQDFYDLNKWLLLLVVTLVVTILWAVRTAASQTITISLSPAVAGMGALFVASLTGVILASPNKLEALAAPYGPTLYAAGFLLFALGATVVSPTVKKWLKTGWYLSLGLLALTAVYQFFGVGKTMFPAISFLSENLWTPVGSTLTLLAIFVITVPMAVGDLIAAVKNKKDTAMALLFSLIVLTLVALALTVIKLIPARSTTILPLRDGWAITLEVLKDPKRALFGVGTENFLYAYSTGRSPQLNTGPLWNLRFTTNASLFLHITATLGFLGLIALVIFGKSLLPKLPLTAPGVTRLLALVSILLVPPTVTLFAVYMLVLLLTEPDHGKPVTFRLPPNLSFVSGGIAVAAVLFVLASVYGVGKVYAAELTFFRSLTALAKNDGMNTYNRQIQTITLAPFVSRYHIAYSQTNLAIANAIATNAQKGTTGQAVTLSDSDRQTISDLIQQSVREGKVAVTLAPESVGAWENLAGIYQSLINVVADVDQWAIATYQRAIQLDPTNPSLRLGLGGVFLLRNDAENAIQQFALAINLKPDWANAHYNLAYAYKLRKDFLREAYSLQQTLQYLPKDSDERSKVDTELAAARQQLTPAQLALLEGRQPTQEEIQGGSSQLSRPDQEPLPVVTPKIELPEDAAPPSTAAGQTEGATTETMTEGGLPLEPDASPTPGTQPQLGPEEVNPSVQPQQ